MESVVWLAAQGLVLVRLVVGLVVYARTRREDWDEIPVDTARAAPVL